MKHRNKNMGTVLFDMDGVLADFDKHVIETIDDERPDIHPYLFSQDNEYVKLPKTRLLPKREHFYISDDYVGEQKDFVRSISFRPGFFRSLKPFDKDFTGWQRVVNMGYEPRICSGPIKENPTCIEDKLAWLEEYMVPKFGRYVVETAILNGKKAEYDGIALIDDKPEVKDSEQANWTHIVWTQSYNKDIETDFRLDRWDGGQLKDVLRRARQRYVDLGKLAITK